MVQVTEYVDAQGRRPFGRWFDRLDSQAATRITAALDRIGRGILSNVKRVGAGVLEYRIDSGPGYRIYFGRDGETLIVLLGGGTKRRQQRDIDTAKRLWRDYRRRRKEE
ncbi:type II toxin-antitoxin system RelE/ParE family toxin [Candidatus Rariloculus sp.]|uniref:type II toxin-antitoxin system RelE/ParE family toxin n=1 Tax=Candidatus Rariloculus sp. TaxID=3101265 RepID=UPI003D119807